MTEVPPRTRFIEFKDRTEPIADSELDAWWSTLPPTRIEDMIGEWAGGEFITGHRMNGRLEKAGWFGKTFN
jgi:GXWXG protein